MWSSRPLLRRVVFLAFVVVVVVTATTAAAASASSRLDERESVVARYLLRYGFLNSTELASDLSDAIRRLQRETGLPVTGVIDDELLRIVGLPRCGLVEETPYEEVLPGPARRAPVRWRSPNITWNLRNFLPSLGSRREIESTLRGALAAWASVANLNFTRISGIGQIDTMFGRGEHGDAFRFDGRGGTLAHAFLPYNSDSDISGDTHFDADEPWTFDTLRDKEGTDFFSVALHEYGHALGLHHTSDPESVMYPIYSKVWNMRRFRMPDVDKRAIQRLYGPRPLDETPTTRSVSSSSSSSSFATSSSSSSSSSASASYEEARYVFAAIRGELFVFRGNVMWRVRNGRVLYGYPVRANRFFRFGVDPGTIDAVYESTDARRRDIVVLTETSVFRFENTRLRDGYPRSLTREYGLPVGARIIEARAVRDGRVYLVSSRGRLWLYDEVSRRLSVSRDLVVASDFRDAHDSLGAYVDTSDFESVANGAAARDATLVATVSLLLLAVLLAAPMAFAASTRRR